MGSVKVNEDAAAVIKMWRFFPRNIKTPINIWGFIGGADNEFSLTVLFPEIALFYRHISYFTILSKVLRRVYWRTPTVSAVMRPEKLSITNEYAASSEKSVPDRRISMKLYTFAIIESKTLSSCQQTSSTRKRRTR